MILFFTLGVDRAYPGRDSQRSIDLTVHRSSGGRMDPRNVLTNASNDVRDEAILVLVLGGRTQGSHYVGYRWSCDSCTATRLTPI